MCARRNQRQQQTFKKTRLRSILFILATPKLAFEIIYFEEYYFTVLWYVYIFLMEKTAKCFYADSSLGFQKLKYVAKPLVAY